MDIINADVPVSAAVRTLPWIGAAGGDWRQGPGYARLRGTGMPMCARDGVHLRPCGTPVAMATTLSGVPVLRADDKFSTRLGPSAGPPV